MSTGDIALHDFFLFFCLFLEPLHLKKKAIIIILLRYFYVKESFPFVLSLHPE